MSDTAASSPNSRFVGVLRILVVVGLAAAAIWLIASQYRLSTEMAAANNDRANLIREVQTLRSAMEKHGAAVNQAVSDSLSKVSDRLDQQTTGMDRALKEHVAAQNKSLADNIAVMSTHIDQQTAVMNRALGKVIPVVMPPEWENQLSQLEARIKEPDRWPKDATEAQGFLDQASSLVESMPAWAEADYLPRLTPVRWAAVAFVSITRPRDDAAIPSIIEETNGLVNATPDGGAADLQRKLKEEAQLLSEKMDQSNLAEAIKVGGIYVQNADSSLDDALADIANVYDVLGLYEKDGPQTGEVRGLRTQLHKLMVMRQGKQQAASLAERWSIVQTLKNDQPGVFEMSVSMLLQEVATTRVALALESIKQPALDDLETALRRVMNETSTQAAKREEERQAKAVRDYQRWALGQIMKFESRMSKDSLDKLSWNGVQRVKDKDGCEGFEDLPGLADAIKLATHKWVPGRFWGGTNTYTWQDKEYKEASFASELRFKAIRDVFVADLLPVNSVLLDAPVQERYQRVFQSAWKQLDGRDDQTFVAEKTALTVKKTVRDFLENQP